MAAAGLPPLALYVHVRTKMMERSLKRHARKQKAMPGELPDPEI